MKSFYLFFLLLSSWDIAFAHTGNIDEIGQAHSDTAMPPRQSISSLRRAAGALSGHVYISDAGKQGFFMADPADSRSPDDSTMTLVTAGGTRFKRITDNGVVNAQWFGAIPGDGQDDWPAIQKAVDFCTAHGDRYSTVHLGPGTYTISQPVILYRWGGASYAFNSTNLEGESSFWPSSGSGTEIQCTFKDKFAIGVELGKGNKISRLKITGKFDPPFAGPFHFYNSTFDDFRDTTCRDRNFSPYAGIAIDPFSISASQIPADGGYPDYTAWYRGSGGIGGPTGISIEDVYIYGFVVGICSSPNSFTRNAELTNIINKIQFANTKLCISGSQDQEKGNVVTNLGCWGVTHTVFATGLYGARTPGNWIIENANIAGYVNRLIYNPQSGYFASHFKNIFAESIGQLGTIRSNQGTIVESSEFGFAYYASDAGQYISPQIDCQGVTFIGCNMRMYGTFKPVTISGASVYIGCSFETVPFSNYPVGDYPSFMNCVIADAPILLGVPGARNIYPPNAWQSFAYGNYSLVHGAATLRIDNAIPAAAYPLDLSANAMTLNITAKNGVNSAVVPLSAEQIARVKPGDIICTSQADRLQGIIGVVTAVANADLTLSYIPSWIVSGHNYYLSIFLPLCNMSFLGDMTAGSNRITNVQADFGSFEKFISIGGLMFCNKFVNTSCNEIWRGSLFRIVSYDAASRTVTLDQRATQTARGVYFSNGNAVKEVHAENYMDGFNYLDKYDAGQLLQEGGSIFIREPSTGRTIRYFVTKSGYYNAAASHDARQAQWTRGSEFVAGNDSAGAAAGISRAPGTSTPPVIAAGPGGGKGAVVNITGSGQAGEITVTTGAAPASDGVVCTITFGSPSAAKPFVVISPGIKTAAGSNVYVTVNGAAGFSIHASSSPLLPGQTYKWTYMLAQ